MFSFCLLIEAAGLTPEFEAGVESFLARRNKNNPKMIQFV